MHTKVQKPTERQDKQLRNIKKETINLNLINQKELYHPPQYGVAMPKYGGTGISVAQPTLFRILRILRSEPGYERNKHIQRPTPDARFLSYGGDGGRRNSRRRVCLLVHRDFQRIRIYASFA